MAQKDIIVPSVKIKDRSVFSLDEFYKMLYRWFESHQYDWQEQEYSEEDAGGKKNLGIRWYTERKIDDYLKYVIEVSFLVIGLENVEVEQGNIKKPTNKGEIEIKIKAYLIKDYDNKWETQPVAKVLRGFYDKYIIKTRIVNYESELYEETYKLMDEIKAFLNLHRF